MDLPSGIGGIPGDLPAVVDGGWNEIAARGRVNQAIQARSSFRVRI